MQPLSKKLASLLVASIIIITSFAIGFSVGISTKPSTINEGLKITGWVKVEVVRDGKLIYVHEGPNLIMNQGKNILAKSFYFSINASQKGFNPNATAVGALGNSTTSPVATQTRLPTEISYVGVSRKIMTVNYVNATQNTLILRTTWTATGSVGAVQQAGLYNSLTNATATGFMAWNTFTSTNLVNNDQITITWTITLS